LARPFVFVLVSVQWGFYVLRVEPIFKHVTIFAGLDDSSLSRLMARARPLTVPADGVIVREGEPGNQLYLIVSGSVRVCKRFGQPDQVELARLNAGDFFGEMCILETLPRAATVQSTSETTLYALPSLAFYDLFRANPEQYSILILNIARDVSRRLRRLDEIFAALH
jgi:CRP/FNR family cyclic AMP-dependent transcriptional regulator